MRRQRIRVHLTAAAAVSAALALTLTACGSGDSSSDGNGAKGGTPASASTSPEASAPATDSAEPAGTESHHGYDPARDAQADIDAAQRAAKGDGKAVLIDFGSGWCVDCQVLGKHFESADIAALLKDKYHVVTVDVGEFDLNLDVAAQYVDLEKSGIPALVVLGPDSDLRVATNQGEFANAHTMDAAPVKEFLLKWA
ncbi:thioredoxin family protein [Streptomyces sp. NPDC051940]|uniref:thioredoxin family protein n=1 Tax=Streptomyces sp. NPDC051940 TaxID=3155675 RepID=UPI00344960A6